MLPYRESRRGDIIVFRYPLNISQDYVKRAIGIPGDHIRLVEQAADAQRTPGERAVRQSTVQTYPDSYRDNFPSDAHTVPLRPRAAEMIEKYVVNGELVVPPGYHFRHGRQSRRFRRQPVLGLGAA